MVSYKILLPLAFAMAITLVLHVEPSSGYKNPSKSHDYILGSRVTGDKLVLQKTIHQLSKGWRILSHKESFNNTKFWRITQVAAFDQKTNGKGGYVKLIKGGPGNQNVTLKFKSQRGYGINFILRVYARQY